MNPTPAQENLPPRTLAWQLSNKNDSSSKEQHHQQAPFFFTKEFAHHHVALSLPHHENVIQASGTDILAGGRGKHLDQHPGNMRLTQLVDGLKHAYHVGSDGTKRHILDAILKILMNDEGRRFLKLVPYNRNANIWYWEEAANPRAKVGQKLRDAYRKQQQCAATLPDNHILVYPISTPPPLPNVAAHGIAPATCLRVNNISSTGEDVERIDAPDRRLADFPDIRHHNVALPSHDEAQGSIPCVPDHLGLRREDLQSPSLSRPWYAAPSSPGFLQNDCNGATIASPSSRNECRGVAAASVHPGFVHPRKTDPTHHQSGCYNDSIHGNNTAYHESNSQKVATSLLAVEAISPTREDGLTGTIEEAASLGQMFDEWAASLL